MSRDTPKVNYDVDGAPGGLAGKGCVTKRLTDCGVSRVNIRVTLILIRFGILK